MKIEDLFDRDIHRSINGVVKAEDLKEASVWQELDEFVVTRELNRHLNDLVSVMLAALEGGPPSKGGGPPSKKDKDPSTDINGIWISGFFGCGKSHFIKVLSYLLENKVHQYGGQRRRAVDFFKGKIKDPVLFADLKRIVETSIHTILFNIDTKADTSKGRDALLHVFLKVLNEKQGFSEEYPHIAHMERYLQDKGKLDVFHNVFERETGSSWLEERDAWSFKRDQVIVALQEALGQSEDSVKAWVDSAESSFSLTVENLARWVKQYLDRHGPDQRIMFLVDEVGQFIGNDTHLMLNLQTITEQLGIVCEGRAWVVVTSQEDLDAVLGDMKSHKRHDFSKIQGRFITRLSLSSSNVDEVIKKRLLYKKEAVLGPIKAAYEGKQDILRNQLSFTKTGMTFKAYLDEDDFAACYPFPAYQFELVQKVFESIRRAGATGLHLAQGERSTLDAFQSAARQLGKLEVGALAAFHRIYPTVERFLEGSVRRIIEHARENHALEPFDATLLKILFLIRYIDELPGTVDNLATLCVEEIDADKLALRKEIEASLARLEAETLIDRNGDLYYFLTNEERDIGREVKGQPVPSGAEERELGKLIFEDILGDVRKHNYSRTGRDFTYTRVCDDHLVGHRLEGSLEVAFISPLGESYEQFLSDQKCSMHTTHEDACVLVRLPDNESLGREVRTYLQTESYVKTKNTGSLPETTKRILRDRTEDNRARRGRIVAILKEMLAEACYFACGKKIEEATGEPKSALGEAMEYLISNAYPKMDYIEHLHANVKQEIQSTLRANDVDQVSLDLATPEANPRAMEELKSHIRLCDSANKEIRLHELLQKPYGNRPYGWPELELVLLVARLAVLKEISLLVDVAPLELEQAYDYLTSASKQRKVIIVKRKVAGDEVIRKARELGHELFGQHGPSSEEGLFSFLKDQLSQWQKELSDVLPLASTGDYPGLGEIEEGIHALRKFVEETDSVRFLERFNQNKNDLLDRDEDCQDIREFYTNQKHSWDGLRGTVQELSQNRFQIMDDPVAGPALTRMEEILANQRPYGMLHEAGDLIHTSTKINDQLVTDAREPVTRDIQGLIDGVNEELDRIEAEPALRSEATTDLERLLQVARQEKLSIAHISQARTAAEAAFDRALTIIEEAQAPPPAKPDDPQPTDPPQQPRVKKRRVVQVKDCMSGSFIETPAEMETFLGKLKGELQEALDANERVQIK